MKRLITITVLGACAASQPAGKPSATQARPAVRNAPPDVVTIDQGTFVLTVQGRPIGRETFTVRRSDVLTIEHDVSLDAPAGKITTRGYLVTDLEWKPRSASLRSSAGGREVVMELVAERPLSMTIDRSGATSKQAATEDVDYFFAQNVMSHLTALCRHPPEAATRHAFPGLPLSIGPVNVLMSTAGPILHRIVDRAGFLSIEVYCQDERLVTAAFPALDLTATRAGSEELISQVRRKERRKPSLANGLVELERTVEVPAKGDRDRATLACSLVVPATHAEIKRRVARGPSAALPAVLLISGSGKQDRDEDTYGPGGVKLSIFKVIANELGKAGIASLRCDDRGTGASSGNFAKATLHAFAADADAAVALLRSEAAIDPRRIGLVGHSEGAIIAPLVAARDRRLSALVLLAGTGRPLDVILVEQTERGLRRDGASQEQIDTAIGTVRAALAAIKRGESLPADLPEIQRKQLAHAEPWLRSHFSHDPAATARTLNRVAVFIAQGDKDQQVTVGDAEALRAAFVQARNKSVEYKIYPDHNHLFAKSVTGNPSEYTSSTAEIDPAVVADLVAFLRERL